MSDLKELFYDWMGANEVIFLGINSIHQPHYDQLMKAISFLGMHEHFPYYFAAITVCAAVSLLYKMVTKHLGKWQSMSIWIGILLMLGTGYLTTGIITKYAKDYFSYPRPYVALMSTGEVHKLEVTDPDEDFRSFPSGHITFITFMLIVLSPLMNTFFTWASLIFITLLGWSRVSLGVHFPADILGGILLIAPVMIIQRWALYTLLRKIFHIKC